MRKFFYLLLAGIISSALVSCSKDDPAPAKDIENKYTNTTILAYNGTEESEVTKCNNATVIVTALDNNNVALNLNYLVGGIPSFDMNGTVENINGIYTIKGEKEIPGTIKVSFNGTIENGVLKTKVVNEILSGKVINTWTYSDISGVMNFSAFNLKNSTGKVMMQSMGNQEVSIEQFNETVNTWVNLIGAMGLQTPQLKFGANGYVSFNGVTPFMPGSTTPQEINYQNITRYTYDPSANTLIFEVPLGSLLSKDQPSISPIFYLKFNCYFDGEIMTAILDEATAKMLVQILPQGAELEALLSMLDGMVPPDFAFFLPIIKTLVIDVVNAVKADNVTSIQIGGNLKPYKAS